jgi:carbon storage regulator
MNTAPSDLDTQIPAPGGWVVLSDRVHDLAEGIEDRVQEVLTANEDKNPPRLSTLPIRNSARGMLIPQPSESQLWCPCRGGWRMLVLTRKPGAKVVIGGNVTVTIVETRGNCIRLGIDAPAHVPILREEICPLTEPHYALAREVRR